MIADIKTLADAITKSQQDFFRLYEGNIATHIDEAFNRQKFQYVQKFKPLSTTYQWFLPVQGFVRVWGLYGYNPIGSDRYLHLYDLPKPTQDAIFPTVTGKEPDEILKIASDDNFGWDWTASPHDFQRGLYIVVSSTALTTTPATGDTVRINGFFLPEAPPQNRQSDVQLPA